MSLYMNLVLIIYFAQVSVVTGAQTLHNNEHSKKFKRKCLKNFLFFTRSPLPLQQWRSRDLDCPPQRAYDDSYEYRPDVWLLPSAESNSVMQMNRLISPTEPPLHRDVLTYELMGGGGNGQGSGRVIWDLSNIVGKEDRVKRDSGRAVKRKRKGKNGSSPDSRWTSTERLELEVTKLALSSSFSSLTHNQTTPQSQIISTTETKRFPDEDDAEEKADDYHDAYYTDSDDDDTERSTTTSSEIISARKSGVNDTSINISEEKAHGNQVDSNYDVQEIEKCSTTHESTPRTRKTTTHKLKSTTTIHWKHEHRHKGHNCHFHYKNQSSRHEQNYYKNETITLPHLTLWTRKNRSTTPLPPNDAVLSAKSVYTLDKGSSRKPLLTPTKRSFLSLMASEVLFPKKKTSDKKKDKPSLLTQLASLYLESQQKQR